ncbi:MarR family winged helix-turn-helix transcriptional regulator [Streptomyces polyrhachis]|uniref:MarR family winged helix-turn-helix transcriptional regulator n=1 Tax=Streptomyces polyrhachis TaxID=1282885 RepID=A0ABW2GAH8_9ACTN
MNPSPDQVPERLTAKTSWLLKELAVQAGRLSHEAFGAAGAKPYWYPLLAALAEFGPSSQAELGRRCRIDRSDVVAAVNALVADGCVERTADPVDRRRNVITLTASGRERLGVLDERLAAVQRELLAPLDTSERTQLTDLLWRLLAERTPERGDRPAP